MLLIGDSNWPAAEIVGVNHYATEHPPLTIVEDWALLGVQRDLPTYEDGFAAIRVGEAVARTHPDLIVTNLGVNDAAEDPAATATAVDVFLDAAAGTPVAWILPPVAGADPDSVRAVQTIVRDAATTHPNVWVIDYDHLLGVVGGCPTLSGGAVVVAPVGTCFVDRGTDVHLSASGRLVLAAVTRAATEAALSGNFGMDLSGVAQDVIAALS